MLAETSQLMIPETFCLRKVQRVKVKVHLNEGLYCNPNNLPGTTQSGESAGTAQTRLGFLGAQLNSVDDPKQFFLWYTPSVFLDPRPSLTINFQKIVPR